MLQRPTCRRPRSRLSQNLTVGEYNLEVTRDFTYLDSKLTWNGDEGAEIQRRIAVATRTYHSLLPVLRSKNVHKRTKLRIYKTMIRSVVTNGGETWTITTGGAEKLDSFERKILRRIYGPIRDGEEWRIRCYHDLYKEPKLSTYVRLLRLRWTRAENAGGAGIQEDILAGRQETGGKA